MPKGSFLLLLIRIFYKTTQILVTCIICTVIESSQIKCISLNLLIRYLLLFETACLALGSLKNLIWSIHFCELNARHTITHFLTTATSQPFDRLTQITQCKVITFHFMALLISDKRETERRPIYLQQKKAMHFTHSPVLMYWTGRTRTTNIVGGRWESFTLAFFHSNYISVVS